jgi:hypothetical protein
MSRKEMLIAREGKRPGLRGKINAFCIHCIYDEGNGGGTWRGQVEACTAPTCPLYSVRPVSESNGVKNSLAGPSVEIESNE